MTNSYSLTQLGWQPFFQQQLSLEEWETCTVARVTGHERSLITALTTQAQLHIPVIHDMPDIAVGDWLLLDQQGRFLRLLDRSSVFMRKAAGTKVDSQLIAANIDTALIVSSMNQDFNLNRIERYLAMAHEAGVEPVVVLTRQDECTDPQNYLDQAQALDPVLSVIAVNSLDPESVKALQPWCVEGRTLSFLGSSGVGKSTLVNTLSGEQLQKTHSIRTDDDKGRHTTTARSLYPLPSGGLLLDTPGMRELQLTDCEHGIEETFNEITRLAEQCKFTDCQHMDEPGCAVQAAIAEGELDERRLKSYQKLLREQAINAATLAEKRARDRTFSRHVRKVMDAKRQQKSSR